MASTLTLIAAPAAAPANLPGAGRRSPVFGLGGRPLGMAVFQLAFGNPYAVGGESLVGLDTYFAEVLSVQVLQNELTVADRREFTWDKTNKKLLGFTAFNTEMTAVDQSAVADVRLLVTGFLK